MTADHNKRDWAVQVLQTIMLGLLISVGAWNLLTTMENSKSLAQFTVEFKNNQAEIARLTATQNRILDDIKFLRDTDNNLDHRVTIIETKTIK